MRIAKDQKGNFRVEDEPTRIEGKAAERFLEGMAARDRGEGDGDRQSFIEESRKIYREYRDKAAR